MVDYTLKNHGIDIMVVYTLKNHDIDMAFF